MVLCLRWPWYQQHCSHYLTPLKFKPFSPIHTSMFSETCVIVHVWVSNQYSTLCWFKAALTCEIMNTKWLLHIGAHIQPSLLEKSSNHRISGLKVSIIWCIHWRFKVAMKWIKLLQLWDIFTRYDGKWNKDIVTYGIRKTFFWL